MVSAKFLELRKRRGMMVAVFILTIGILVVIDGIFLILHATAPHSYGPAGGISKFRAFSLAFVQLFGISAILVGAAAGSSDLTDGVFRHLVVTGRSRLALFASRFPAGLMVILPFTAIAYAIEALIGALCAPKGDISQIVGIPAASVGPQKVIPHVIQLSATPDVHLMVLTGLWLMLSVVIAYTLGLGLGALTGSRYVTVAILIAFQLIVTPIMSGVSIPHLINLQRAFVGVAIAQLEPSGLISLGGGGGGGGGGNGALLSIPPMPTFGLAIVITAWFVGWLAIGAWRTIRRDV